MNFLVLLILLPLQLWANESPSEGLRERVEELDLRLGDLEINQALKKFSFSGTFMNQLEYYSRAAENTGLIPGVNRMDSTNTHLNPAAMKLELNIDTKVSKELNFFSTISMAKYYNLSDRNKRNKRDSGSFISFAGSNNYKDSGAYFDMAYISYNANNSPWTLAVGRMPTNNGPPLNQADGNSRTGTYPSLSFNNILDGIAGIYSFKNMLPKEQSLKIRVFYTPLTRMSLNDKSDQEVDGDGNAYNGEYGESGEKIASSGFLGTLLTEYSIENLAWAEKVDIYHSTYRVSQFFSTGQQKLPVGTPGVPSEYTRDGIEYFDVTSQTVYLGADQFFNTPFNISFTYAHYDIDFSGESYKSENYMGTINYTFSGKKNAGDIAGIEYLHTDKNRIPSEETSFFTNDFYNMMNGEGYHLYYTKVVDANQLVRLGYFSYYTQDSIFLLDDLKTNESATYIRWKVFF